MNQTQQQDPRLGMTLDELRAWLDRQNVEYLRQQSATEEDHKKLVEQLRAAVHQAQVQP